MELAPGRYRIEASAPGYRTHYGWHQLSQEAPVYVAELERLPEPAAPSVTAPESRPTPAAAPPSSPRTGQVWRERETGMEFVWVPGGCYQMGSSSGDDDEKPVPQVCVDGFWMGRTEVTQGQWRKLMGSNPSWFKSGEDHPVDGVSWNDVQEYIGKLNARSRERFRLPTEAEWEYACRSGGKAETYSGGESLDRVGWYGSNAGGQTHAVAGKAANGLGLYDMSGNVWEWVQDVYDSDAYASHSRNNPVNSGGGSSRVRRGGSWYGGASNARCASRSSSGPGPGFRDDDLGFRLLRTSN